MKDSAKEAERLLLDCQVAPADAKNPATYPALEVVTVGEMASAVDSCGNEVTAIGHVAGALARLGHPLTPAAVRVLDAAQDAQDMRATWSEALARAEDAATGMAGVSP